MVYLLPWEIIPIVPVDTVTPCPTCPTTSAMTTGTITIEQGAIGALIVGFILIYLIREMI